MSLPDENIGQTSSELTASAWAATGSLHVARQDHIAAMLRNGNLLVAGGLGGSGSLSSAETYNPTTKLWTNVASMSTARTDFAACLLPDGRVLVSGGYINTRGALASAEIYDPTTNAWSAAGTLVQARQDHQMTCLPDGRALVTGGYSGITTLDSAEIFDMRSNSWTPAASMPFATHAHRVVTLGDGRVMVVGGRNNFGSLSLAALWTPSTGAWAFTASMPTARAWHTVDLLSDGRVLAAGGANSAVVALANAEIYDPNTSIWTAVANLNTARYSDASASLSTGPVLVGGVNSFGGTLNSSESYDPTTNSWTQLTLASKTHNQTATALTTTSMLVAGGQTGTGFSAAAQLYGVCSSPTATNGTPCDDGNPCTVGDSCQNGACAPGAQSTCNAIPGATVVMGTNSKLSASIYDSTGQVVRHLYELAPRSGSVSLGWDGKDDSGYDAPTGTYDWRAITTNAVGADDGSVGDLGKTVPGHNYGDSDDAARVHALTYDSSGNLYILSDYEENGGLRRIDVANFATGLKTWTGGAPWGKGNAAIITDDTYVYTSSDTTLHRWLASTGELADWSAGGLTLYSYTTGQMPIAGLAVDAQYLWVADPVNNKIWVFNKGDGSPANILAGQNSLAFPDGSSPRGMASDGANHFWIAMAGSAGRVQEYTYTPSTQTFTPGPQTPALNQPYGVAWYHNGATSILYATEIGTGHVHKYDVSGAAPVELARFLEHMLDAGAVSDNTVGWKFGSWGAHVPGGDAAIAVSPDGSTFGVVDLYNSRTMFYSTLDGAVLASPRQMGFAFPGSQSTDLGISEDSLTVGWMQYQVLHNTPDPDYGHPFTLKYNWQPTDDPSTRTFSPVAMHRKLSNGTEYLYYMVSDPVEFPWGGIIVYRLNSRAGGSGMKRCAQIKVANQVSTIEVRVDTNGNGILDDGAGNADPGDTVTSRTGVFGGGTWVAADGTIWFTELKLDGDPSDGIGKWPVSSFDSQLNPIYDVSPSGPLKRVSSLPGEPILGSWAVSPSAVRIDPIHNRAFMSVATPNRGRWFYGGATAVETLDLTNGQQSVLNVPTQAVRFKDITETNLSFPPQADLAGLSADTDGNYFYTGSNSPGSVSSVRMFTWDGLPVARAFPNAPINGVGWFDNSASLTAFTHSNGTHYAYAEDVGFGRSQRYAFTSVATTHRWGTNPDTGETSGNFAWTGPTPLNGLVAWWRMDETSGAYIVDSTGHGHFGEFYLGNTSTPGVINGAKSFNGAATGTSVVTLGQNDISQKPDNLIDGGTSSILTLTAWVQTSGSGVVMGIQDLWYGQTPANYAPVLYVGQDGKLYGGVRGGSATLASPSAIADGKWHHVALVVSSSSQTLFVDGAPVGSTSGGLTSAGMTYTLLGDGYTSASASPSTPGGYFPYAGALDDMRLYNRVLSNAEIAALASPVTVPSGPVAWWKFDETAGAMASDATDHGKDATVVNGSWQPTGGHLGGALSLDGATSYVKLPEEMIESPAYQTLTITSWFKTAAGGVIIEYQVGPLSSTTAGLNGYFPALDIEQDGILRAFIWGGTQRRLLSPKPVNDNQWHHVALVVDMTTLTLYLDGVAVDTVNGTYFPAAMQQVGATGNQLGAGFWMPPRAPASWPASGWSYYNGLLDDVRIYGRVLTQSEVQALAAQ